MLRATQTSCGYELDGTGGTNETQPTLTSALDDVAVAVDEVSILVILHMIVRYLGRNRQSGTWSESGAPSADKTIVTKPQDENHVKERFYS